MTSLSENVLRAAVGQFPVVEDWEANASVAGRLIDEAERDGVQLLVLPEGIMTRFIDRKEKIREAAQALNGPFVEAMREHSRDKNVTVIFGVHELSDDPRPFNTLVVLRDGQVIEVYRKLHLYDAFEAVESDNVRPGNERAPIISVAGFAVGLMTCYDVRFPEQARDLADRGAEVIALPAAWAAGRTKEFQWSTLVSARALDATVFVVASDESGPSCVGASKIVDPLGSSLAACTEVTSLAVAELRKQHLNDVRTKLPVLQHRRFSLSFTPTEMNCRD
ncbi:hydrolase [Brevibacterium sp. ACRRH]|uniref:nitrilase-related carbon-nitrogen hydrolase n=1 Tax=Brevibacterium sp. ACRRH TaxID=2918183 RepID=UPI001EF6CA0B|nr:nitrilase-related carbon-nitrogen hydrolase [Brevibacterium sp. ACRRH]MCG7297918.1 hydrolase [Brevibacterium sp. ACRRH]